jgi:Porin subfamily
MDRSSDRPTGQTGQTARRTIATLAAVLLAAGAPSAETAAQTLTAPNTPGNRSAPQQGTKPRPAAHTKSCAAFGAGFVNIPGTDGCIKLGGWVGVEGSVRR